MCIRDSGPRSRGRGPGAAAPRSSAAPSSPRHRSRARWRRPSARERRGAALMRSMAPGQRS
eukprot:6081043-Prymnesium_polylepis.1